MKDVKHAKGLLLLTVWVAIPNIYSITNQDYAKPVKNSNLVLLLLLFETLNSLVWVNICMENNKYI